MANSIFQKLKHHPTIIRWTTLEFLPIYIINIPVLFIILWYALKARSLFFFTTVNPSIPTGGFFGERKDDILDMVPDQYKPKTVLIAHDADHHHIKAILAAANISYPLILKPNIGERGLAVAKIQNTQELLDYFHKSQVDVIAQDYIDYEHEVSILFHRLPSQPQGTISSFCIKLPLKVVGNGQDTLAQLIDNYPRAILQRDRLHEKFKERWDKVVAQDEEVILEVIGNHSRGATFLNANHRITPTLIDTFQKINEQLEEVYFARYDIKCASLESLEVGEELAILEINGVGSEPAHVYDPSYKLSQFIRDMKAHWATIYSISVEMRKRGVVPLSLKEGLQHLSDYRKQMRQTNSL